MIMQIAKCEKNP